MRDKSGTVSIVVAIIGFIGIVLSSIITGIFSYNNGQKSMEGMLYSENQALNEKNNQLQEDYKQLSKEYNDFKNKIESFNNSESSSSNTSTNTDEELDSSDWMDQCPPYQVFSNALGAEIYDGKNGKTFEVSGEKIIKGFTLPCSESTFAIFNLSGKYSSVSFYAGHAEGHIFSQYSTMKIFLDGELYKEYQVDATDIYQKYDIPLDHANSMKITLDGGGTTFGFFKGRFKI
ncbi:hypothetical protein [Candidatus Soleaferrea massiliensis]|uniref:hypothetical protein n=1 Tax=Candidatus Soleaferrea massiliensis TaxID=1470354 RepID=UPI0012E0B474|nr:hypothetical protein [Candidatus Soleaferrea massiliensis]